MRGMMFIGILLVLTLVSSGCISATGNQTSFPPPPGAGPVGSLVNSGGTAVAIAVSADEITTPYPEAKDLFIKGLTVSTQYAHYNESLAYFDQALGIDPDFAEAWYAKGVALHNLKRYDEAIQCYDRALTLNPRNAAVWSLKGTALADEGHHPETAECFRKASEIDPHYLHR